MFVSLLSLYCPFFSLLSLVHYYESVFSKFSSLLMFFKFLFTLLKISFIPFTGEPNTSNVFTVEDLQLKGPRLSTKCCLDQWAEFTSELMMMMLGYASLKKNFLFYFWDTDPLEPMVCNGDTVRSLVTSPFLQGQCPPKNLGAESRWFCNCMLRLSLLCRADVLWALLALVLRLACVRWHR